MTGPGSPGLASSSSEQPGLSPLTGLLLFSFPPRAKRARRASKGTPAEAASSFQNRLLASSRPRQRER
jgi:hypothetical protein